MRMTRRTYRTIPLFLLLLLSVVVVRRVDAWSIRSPIQQQQWQYTSHSILPVQQPKRRRSSMCSMSFSTKHNQSLISKKSGMNSNTALHDSSSSSSSSTIDGGEEKEEYEWSMETIKIGLPALIGMIVDPLLSIIDTGFVGRTSSSIELASLGACTSIFHLAFNSFRSTTAATTSLVATALASKSEEEAQMTIETSLKIGIAMGIVVLHILIFGCQPILATMGIRPNQNPLLFLFAKKYLTIRALAAPSVLLITVAEGAFRGYADTTIPLIASMSAAIINIVLDPLFMLTFLRMGIQGAALATAIAQYGAAAVYLFFLQKRNMLPKFHWRGQRRDESTTTTTTHHHHHHPNTQQVLLNGENKKRVGMAIFKANLAMLGKQGSLLLGWAYATAKATRIGTSHVAAHQVALSFWLIFAFLFEGAAVSAQVLMSRCIGKLSNTNNTDNNNDDNDNNATMEVTNTKEGNNNDNNERAPMRSLVSYMLRLAIGQGLLATLVLSLSGPYVISLFTKDVAIKSWLVQLMPILAGQQVLISLTLVAEGLAVGGSQFSKLAFGTTLSTIAAFLTIRSCTSILEIWSKGIVILFIGRLITALFGILHVIFDPTNQNHTFLSKNFWIPKKNKNTNNNKIPSSNAKQ